MSQKDNQNPEVDLLIIESLEFEFKSVNDIAQEINVDAGIISATLDELYEQGMAIEKKGLSYRIAAEEDE
tara:strand:- start:268 stop:477 length:210 start_codon:yes stop_codon:yes gene_type:complete